MKWTRYGSKSFTPRERSWFILLNIFNMHDNIWLGHWCRNFVRCYDFALAGLALATLPRMRAVWYSRSSGFTRDALIPAATKSCRAHCEGRWGWLNATDPRKRPNTMNRTDRKWSDLSHMSHTQIMGMPWFHLCNCHLGWVATLLQYLWLCVRVLLVVRGAALRVRGVSILGSLPQLVSTTRTWLLHVFFLGTHAAGLRTPFPFTSNH